MLRSLALLAPTRVGWFYVSKRPWQGLLAVCVALCASPSAWAASTQCVAIASQLASLERSRAATDFDGAANRQRSELASARAQKAKCDASNPERCGTLATLVAGMEANLATLERKAKARNGREGSSARLVALQRSYRAAQCEGEARKEETASRANVDNIGLLAWFGQNAAPPAQAESRAVAATAAIARPAVQRAEPKKGDREGERRAKSVGFTPSRFGGASYRTLCVRTCDGYFWPVSFQTSSRHFTKDAEICRSACPSSEVALYVHRNPGGGPDDAVGLNGKPYTALKTAYRFRKEFDQSCACRALSQPNLSPDSDAPAPPEEAHDVAPSEPRLPVILSTRPPAPSSTEVIGEFGLRGAADPEL